MSGNDKNSSLMDGIDGSQIKSTKSGQQRISLDDTPTPRMAIDASWSPRKKKLVAIACGVVTCSAVVAGGFLVWRSIPVDMPTNVDQAIATIQGVRFKGMDRDRQKQYYAEAARLMRSLSDAERQKLRDNPDMRDQLRPIFESQFDEMIKKVARGEEPDMPFMRPPGGPRPDGAPKPDDKPGEPKAPNADGPRRMSMEDMTPEQRQQMETRIKSHIAEMINSGNAQMAGLRGEMMRKRGGGGGMMMRGPR